MKKILLTPILAVFSVCAFAQSNDSLGIRPWSWTPKNSKFTTQSFDYNRTSTSLSFLYLNDGVGNNFTAFAYPLFQVTGLGNKVGIYAVGAADMNHPNTNIYAGTAVGVNLVRSKGFNLDAYVGLKGFDLSNKMTFASGDKGSYVFGLGLTVPIH